ncbi:MAG: purine-nucleoside phosphorylase [Ignavibacteria bacterium]|nr:purine-nucleoside phosphorylase [Ignavibacteria bacterium]
MVSLAMINDATNAIRVRYSGTPAIGIILGTGLGALAECIKVDLSIPYEDIPHFPVSTVESHTGRLLIGTLQDKPVMVMQGRFHQYEGYSLQQITLPVRVFKMLGVRTLIVSNACGGMNPLYRRGDIMLIDDHINFLGDNPLIGPNLDELGPRFPDMSEPYSQRLLSMAEESALELGIKVHRGVYVAVTGPNLETRAEYRFLRALGADVVGMSTVPECIVARHMDMDVLGLSIITDQCFPDSLHPVSLEHVLEAAAIAEPKMTSLVTHIVSKVS